MIKIDINKYISRNLLLLLFMRNMYKLFYKCATSFENQLQHDFQSAFIIEPIEILDLKIKEK